MHGIAGHRRFYRCAQILPVRKKFIQSACLKHVAGKDMSANFGPLLNHDDRQFLAGITCQLHKATCGRKPRGTAADNDNVKFHGFAFCGFRHRSGHLRMNAAF